MEKEIAIFKTDSETINVEVLFEDETVWLTQDQMAQMFEKSKSTINEHIKHIFEEGELDESKVTYRIFYRCYKTKALLQPRCHNLRWLPRKIFAWNSVQAVGNKTTE